MAKDRARTVRRRKLAAIKRAARAMTALENTRAVPGWIHDQAHAIRKYDTVTIEGVRLQSGRSVGFFRLAPTNVRLASPARWKPYSWYPLATFVPDLVYRRYVRILTEDAVARGEL